MTEETTTGVKRLYQMHKEGRLGFPAINVNDSVTKSKFDNLYGCRESLVDGIKRATDVMIAGKVAVVAGYGDVGKGSRAGAARAVGAGVDHRDRPDLRAAGGDGRLPRRHDGLRRDKADIFVTATGNIDVITHEHMKRMKNNAIVCNIGHFDNEIDVAALKAVQVGEHQAAGRSRHLPGRQADHPARRRAPREPRLRHRPSVVRDELVVRQPGDGADRAVDRRADRRRASIPVGVYVLPKHLDEKVARLQLSKLGAMLTPLSDKQARYIGVRRGRPVQAGRLPVLTAALRPGAVPHRGRRRLTSTKGTMRIAVMGAGGVGGYFGARLAQAGHDVAFVARGRASRRDARARPRGRRARSATCTSPRPARPTIRRRWRRPTSCCSRSSSGTPRPRPAAMRPLLARGGVVIPFQNGVESIERVGAVRRRGAA